MGGQGKWVVREMGGQGKGWSVKTHTKLTITITHTHTMCTYKARTAVFQKWKLPKTQKCTNFHMEKITLKPVHSISSFTLSVCGLN